LEIFLSAHTTIVVNAAARVPWEVVNRYEGCAHFHTLNRPMYIGNFFIDDYIGNDVEAEQPNLVQ